MSAPIWYDSTETGAPVLNNAAGSLISLLRAVLINGFNVRAITGITVAAGVATVTCPAHGYSSAYGKWLQITGANAPLLNGVKQQTIVDANTFTFPAPGVANGSYTATDARRAPLGWQEEFVNGGNTVAIYRRTAPEATAQKLRVDDQATAPTDARVIMVETATGVDTYTGVSPALVGGYFWFKGGNTAAAKRWKIVGDDLGFFYCGDLSAAGHYRLEWFGDVQSFRAADAYHTMITGQTVVSSGAGNLGWINPVTLGQTPGTETATFARRSTQLGASVKVGVHHIGPAFIGSNGPTFPSPVDNGCVIAGPLFLNEDVSASGFPIRAAMPGVAQPLCARPFADNQVVDTLVNSTKRFLAVPLVASNQGQALIDLTDWR